MWRLARVRRALAALLLGLAAWVAFAAFAPGREMAASAVVAAGDLPAGHRLGSDDIRVQSTDPRFVPAGAVPESGAAVGQVLSAPVASGEVLTTARLRPADTLRPLPAQQRAVHVPIADAGSAAIVRPGDRVDLVAVAGGAVVASDVLVLSVDAAAESGDGLSAGAAGSPAGLVVAVPSAHLTRLVPAALDTGGDGVHVALRSTGAAGETAPVTTHEGGSSSGSTSGPSPP